MRRAVVLMAALVAVVMLPAPAGARLHRSVVGCWTQRCDHYRAYWRRQHDKLTADQRASLRRLRGCETRGMGFPRNYRAATGNGYYGAYQYLPSTWARAGGHGVASAAIPAEQDVRTARFIAAGHASEWACRA